MTTQILMPALSPTMEEGKLAKWHVKEGDEVHSGDILAEIETDKATMEFEASDEGRIGKILVAEGTEGVKVNAPIAILLGEGEDANSPPDIPTAMSSIKAAVTAEAKTESRSPLEGEPKSRSDFGGGAARSAALPLPEATSGASTLPQGEERVFASPLAKRIAEQKGIDLAAVSGSGPRGRIVKSDVERRAARHRQKISSP
jgi:pyruvate dehydrogenase E2 component (dihydrolipoamide acetyltransferase)